MPLNPSLKKVVAGGGGEAIASYDSTDIAAGTGVEVFYGGQLANSGALSSDVFYSDRVVTSWAGTASGGFIEMGSKAFLVPFNLPRVVNGRVIANIPLAITVDQNSQFVYLYPNCKLYHVTNTAETLIAQNSGAITNTILQTAGQANYMFAVEMEAKQKFKKDESLKLDVGYWQRKQSGAASNYVLILGHDPRNRLSDGKSGETRFTSEATELTLQVPFKIEI